MDDLEAGARPGRYRLVAGAAIAAGAIAVAAYVLTRESAARGPCSAPEVELARAWSPELHDELVRAAPQLEGVARRFDRYAHAWLEEDRSACAAPVEARVGCFLAIRDALAEQRAVLLVAKPASPSVLLPEFAQCTGPRPIPPPVVPDGLRAKIRELRGRAMVLADPAALLADAERLGWRPLVAEILLAGGLAAEQRGELPAALALLGRAVAEAALAQHAHVEDLARIGLLELDLTVQDDPDDAGEFARRLGDARAAIAASGDAVALRARIEAIEGDRLVGQRQLREALPHLDSARIGFASAGDLVRAARVTRVQALALLATGGDGATAITEAVFRLVRAASDRAAYDILVDVRRELEWRDGKYDDAHGDDRRSAPTPTGTTTTGRVLDATGAPVGDAIVVAWRGTLGGDARRIYARHDAIDGDLATTAKDGTFTLRVPPHGAIMAERDTLRSQPALAGAGPLELHLGRTTKAEGIATTVEDASLATGCAWFALDAETAWTEDAPIGKDGHFVLDNLPAAAPLCVRDDHHRLDVTAAPSGRPLDVIVRGGEPGMRVVAPTAWGIAGPVGAANLTDAGRALRYLRGDLHAVLDGLVPGPQEVCAIAGDRRTCTTVDMPRDPPSPDAKAIATVIQIEAIGVPTKPSDGR